jgi:hypothetical protein
VGDFGSRGSRRAGAHPSAARRAAAPLRCAGARWTRTPREGSRDPGYRLDDPSHRSRSADPRHPGRGRGGQSQRRPQARRGEWSLDPFTTVQRAPARGAPLEGFRGMGAIATQQPLPLQALGNVRGHLMSGVDLALRRIPEIMRHESQRERLGPRPWQRPAGRDVRLSLQIDEVRR